MAISTIPLPVRPPTSSSTSSSSSLLTPTPTTPIRHNHHHHHHHQPTYIRSGIGGAGNWHKASTIPPPPPPQSPATSHNPHGGGGGGGGLPVHDNSAPLLQAAPHHLRTTSSTHFKSGIGGAGNTHPLTARHALDFDEELARCRAVERRLPAAYHVGIGGAGNSRSRAGDGCGGKKRPRPRTSAGAALGMRRRSEGELGIEAAAAAAAEKGALPMAMVEVVEGGGAVKRVSWGEEDSVDEFEVDGYEGDGEMDVERECVYYSNEPLPYGALDVLRRRLERAFASRNGGGNGGGGGGREVLASPRDKRHGAVLVGSQGERRGLRSHRSMWRF